VKETLLVLKKSLKPIFLPDPSEIDLKKKANEFCYKWNFPNCILAIDGKHIRVRSPDNSGSLFHNYKDFFPSFCWQWSMLTVNLWWWI